MKKYKILLVDDDVIILKTIGPALENEGYEVTTASNGEKAIEFLNTKQFDLVITDLVMEEVDGIGVLKKAKELSTKTMVIILTGYGDINSAINALRLDADDYLLKPCELEEISLKVSSLLEKLEIRRTLDFYENILPVCSVCKKIRDDTGKEHGCGEWLTLENYMWTKAGVLPSHTYCPECAEKAMAEIKRVIPI